MPSAWQVKYSQALSHGSHGGLVYQTPHLLKGCFQLFLRVCIFLVLEHAIKITNPEKNKYFFIAETLLLFVSPLLKLLPLHHGFLH